MFLALMRPRNAWLLIIMDNNGTIILVGLGVPLKEETQQIEYHQIYKKEMVHSEFNKCCNIQLRDRNLVRLILRLGLLRISFIPKKTSKKLEMNIK